VFSPRADADRDRDPEEVHDRMDMLADKPRSAGTGVPRAARRRTAAGVGGGRTAAGGGERTGAVRAVPAGPVPTLADRLRTGVDLVVGVDTHADTHTAAVCDPHGGVLETVEIDTDEQGLTALLDLVLDLVTTRVPADPSTGAAPVRVVWALEGTGSYGAGLREVLQDAGQEVVEVPRAKRERGSGKSDAKDAVAIARTALAAEHLAVPRTGTVRGALRQIAALRRANVATRTRLVNQFKAVLVTAPVKVRDRFRTATGTAAQLKAAAALRARRDHDLATTTTVAVLRQLAAQIRDLDELVKAADKQLDALTAAHAPALRAEPGVGPVVAADLLIAFSAPDRFRDEAAFAKFTGTAPLEASSGKTTRHRLNPGGDRTANAALHRVVLTRRRMHHPDTAAYVARRRTDPHHPKTDKEINRCLRRALARHLYRIMKNMPPLP
jgi:transposase